MVFREIYLNLLKKMMIKKYKYIKHYVCKKRYKNWRKNNNRIKDYRKNNNILTMWGLKWR